MGLIYPNIVPENNLRLPDALTIKHGPARLLAGFVLDGDKLARQMGVRLRLRYDFADLVYVNQQETSKGNWFRLTDMFNPGYCDLNKENSYWISGEDEHGEIVLTQAGRIFYWPETTLEQEVRLMFYGGHEADQECRVTAPAAKSITGVVFCAGSHWIRPDFRGKGLSRLLGRLGRAYAVSRWPVDWAMALVTPVLVAKGVASGYGYRHLSRSVFFPGSPLGDLELVVSYLSAPEAYDDLASFMTVELAGAGVADADAEEDFTAFASPLSPLDHRVTKISSEPVFQGSSNRS
jgi:hypothetical protein